MLNRTKSFYKISVLLLFLLPISGNLFAQTAEERYPLIPYPTVVDNDGLHSAIEKSGQVALKKGLHPFVLDFIEGRGVITLKLQYSREGEKARDIPQSWLKYATAQ